MMPPVNEKEHTVSRITREGKNITYKLSVMQQPERARACGAGAKCALTSIYFQLVDRKGKLTGLLTASADRRPVDPPPVVELRIFESDPNDDLHKTDITFAYNANFFLFATLETARPIAHGRVTGPPTCPVLTGVPVAGIAYLDRPSQAGYFIFPDLSVRHEGRYRLSFHLYEDIKDPKDADRDAPMPNLVQPLSSKPTAPQSSLNFRLEVKSVPFTVYSAKKFPGLATSTSLSRIIAEQGCRVRIRRDVRMRRRGDKRTDDFESNEERVYAAQRQAEHRYSTPDAYAATPIERPRSTSTSTVEPAFPYGPEAQRRPSAPEYGFPQPYQRPMPAAPPAPAPPAPPAHASPYPSHLSFGTSQPPYPAPQLPPTPQSTAPTNPYSPHLSYSHTRHPSSSGIEYESAGYPYPQPPPSTEQSNYPKAALPPLRLEPPKGFNNAQPIGGEFRSSDPNAYQSLTHPPAQRSQTPTPSSFLPSLPPLSSLSGGEYLHNMPSNMVQSPSHDMMAPNKRVLYENPSSKLTKRSHEESFGFEERPLHNGMRPDAEEYPSMDRKLSVASSGALFSEPRDEMAYKRANGKMVMKVTPALQ